MCVFSHQEDSTMHPSALLTDQVGLSSFCHDFHWFEYLLKSSLHKTSPTSLGTEDHVTNRNWICTALTPLMGIFKHPQRREHFKWSFSSIFQSFLSSDFFFFPCRSQRVKGAFCNFWLKILPAQGGRDLPDEVYVSSPF